MKYFLSALFCLCVTSSVWAQDPTATPDTPTPTATATATPTNTPTPTPTATGTPSPAGTPMQDIYRRAGEARFFEANQSIDDILMNVGANIGFEPGGGTDFTIGVSESAGDGAFLSFYSGAFGILSTVQVKRGDLTGAANLRVNSLTDTRNFSFPDKSGTIAMLDDVGSGITANVLPKGTGSAITDSRISDDGTDISINSGGGITTIGDALGAGAGTKITLNDTSKEIHLNVTDIFFDQKTSNGAVHTTGGNGQIAILGSGDEATFLGLGTAAYRDSTTFAPIAATGRFTAQTAAKATVVTFTSSADGSFEVSANVLVTTATVHSFTATVTYTDEGNTSRVVTMQFSTLAGAFVTAMTNAQGTVPYEGVPLHIRVKASTAITIGTTGTFTSVAYNVEGIIRQLN